MITALFYSIVFFVIFLFANRGEKRGDKKMIYYSYIILALLTILRYDVGNDYESYCNAVNDLVPMFSRSYDSIDDLWVNYMFWTKGTSEPTFLLFSYIFHSFPYPQFWVIALFYIISIFFLYKTLKAYECHRIGLVLFFVSGLMFWYWDMVRQCVAVSIFFYATTFIRDGKILKYLSMVLLGMCFHLSMIFTLPLYFSRYLNLNRWIYFLIVVLSILLLFSGFSFSNLLNNIEKLPFYSNYSEDSRVNLIFESFGYKVRMAFHGIVTLYTIYKMPKEGEYLTAILTFGTVFFMLAMGNLIIQRIMIYPYYIIIVAFPLAIKQIPKKALVPVYFLIFVFYMLNTKNIIDGTDRGCSPYKTVFSEDFSKGIFKYRGY